MYTWVPVYKDNGFDVCVITDVCVHFTWTRNVLIAEACGYLGNPPESVKPGCRVQTNRLYLYNVDICRKYQLFPTIPPAILEHPLDFSAFVLQVDPLRINHCIEECCTKWEDNDPMVIPLEDYFVVSVPEGLALLGTSIDCLLATQAKDRIFS